MCDDNCCCSDDVDDPSRRESASPAASPEHDSEITSSDKTSNTDSIMLLSDDSTKTKTSARKRGPTVRSLSPTPVKAKIPRTDNQQQNSRAGTGENGDTLRKIDENILTLDDLTPSSSSSRRDSLEIIAPSPQSSLVKSQKRGRKPQSKDTNLRDGKKDKPSEMQKKEVLDKSASFEGDKSEELISSSNSIISPSGQTRSRASLSNLIPSSSDASNVSSALVISPEPDQDKDLGQTKENDNSVPQKEVDISDDSNEQETIPSAEAQTPQVEKVSPSSKSPEDMFVDAIASFDEEFVDAEEALDNEVTSEASGPVTRQPTPQGPVTRQPTPQGHMSRASPRVSRNIETPINEAEENKQSHSTRSLRNSARAKQSPKVTPARIQDFQNDASPLLSTRRSTRSTPKASPKITPKNVNFKKFSPLNSTKSSMKESPQVTRLRSQKLVETSDDEMFTDDSMANTPKEIPQVRRLRKRNHIDSSDESGTEDSQDSPRRSGRKLKKSTPQAGSGSDVKQSPQTRRRNDEKQANIDERNAAVSPSPLRQRRQKAINGSPHVGVSPMAIKSIAEKVATSSPALATRSPARVTRQKKKSQDSPDVMPSKEKVNEKEKLSSKNMESPIIVQRVDKEITLSFRSPTPEHNEFINSNDGKPASKQMNEIQEEKIRSSPRLRNVTDYKANNEGKKNTSQEKTPSAPINVLKGKIRESPRPKTVADYKAMNDGKLADDRPSRSPEKSKSSNERRSTSSADELSPTRLSPRLTEKRESPKSPPRKRFSEVDELRLHTSPGTKLGRWTKPGPTLYKIPPEVSRVVDKEDLQKPIMKVQSQQEGLPEKETDLRNTDDTSDTPTRRSTRNTPKPETSSAAKADVQAHR